MELTLMLQSWRLKSPVSKVSVLQRRVWRSTCVQVVMHSEPKDPPTSASLARECKCRPALLAVGSGFGTSQLQRNPYQQLSPQPALQRFLSFNIKGWSKERVYISVACPPKTCVFYNEV